ncbi:hypothetical protein MHU86_3876 [Fragilaria crotonensis]|nr:hypothetical protein MHU86_3876 [Fragilaria crotonensis]
MIKLPALAVAWFLTRTSGMLLLIALGGVTVSGTHQSWNTGVAAAFHQPWTTKQMSARRHFSLSLPLTAVVNNNDNDDNSNDNDDMVKDSWDDDVDYDKLWKDPSDMDQLPTSAWDDLRDNSSSSTKDNDVISLGFPTELLSDLLDAETAAQLKEDAKLILENKVQEGLDELAKMRVDLKKDIESQKRAMERSSRARKEREETKLLNKIDDIYANFMNESKEMRESTKLAAAADKAMEATGGGVDVGSWGVLGGADITLSSSFASDVSSGIVLGSVENAKQQQQQGDAAATLPPAESRILIVADESSDPFAKQLIPTFTKALQDIIAVDIEIVKPTQQMPLGGNNAACVLFFLTSLSSPPRAILERLLRRTMGLGGTVGRPPTQLVAISTIGTERTDKFPYSMQNLMGRKLENRRDMEESLVTTVKERNTQPPLDYTILKFGELKDSQDDNFAFAPGDVLDGTTSLELATQTLIQAIAFQPAARNATLCTTGSLPIAAAEATKNGDMFFWDDAFLKLKGPELVRFESLDIQPDKFDQLSEYLKEWGKLFEGVSKRDGFKLVFRSTRTGQNYLSKEEERELEKRGLKPSSSTTSRGKAEGGVQVLVELTTKGNMRVRATRTNMGPETVIKELSETTILKRLEDSLELFVRDFA